MIHQMVVALGRDSRGEGVAIDLVAPAHALLTGATRSGKTSLIYALISRAIQSSGDAQVAGCDVSSLLLHPLAGLPGEKLRATGGGEFKSHMLAMSALVAEMDRRIDLLLERQEDKYTEFDAELPLVLCVFDEFPSLVALAEADDAATARKAGERRGPILRRAFRRLVMEGAKVGFRVWVVATRADASILGGAERSNCAVRISLRADGPDAIRMLHPYATDIDAHTFPPGVGLIEEPSRGLRTAHFSSCSYADYLAAIRVAIRKS